MPFDNNGIFKLIYNWTNEKNSGRDLISAGKMDEQTEDMADALTSLKSETKVLQNDVSVTAEPAAGKLVRRNASGDIQGNITGTARYA